jgi:hypothetical protein
MKSSRFVFQLAPSARPTAETVSGLLPTARPRDWKAEDSRVRAEGMDLPTRISLLPTPSASLPNDGEDPQTWLARAERLKEKHGNGNGAGMPLAIAVKLLPTLDANDGMRGVAKQYDPKARNQSSRTVTTAVAMLPTLRAGNDNRETKRKPSAQAGKHGSSAGAEIGESLGLRLQPAFAAWMMGFPEDWTESPFRGGAASR